MARHVRGIFSSVQKINLRNSSSIDISAIVRESEKSRSSAIANDILTATGSRNQVGIRVAWQTLTAPRPKPSVLFVCKKNGLQHIESKPLTRRREQIAETRGVTNNLPLVPFYDLVKNFSNKLVHLSEKMVILIGAYFTTLRVPYS